MNFYVTFSDELDSISPSCLRSNELDLLSNMEHKLSQDDVKNYSNIWTTLAYKNSPLRVINNGNVLSVDLDYFDDFILSLLKQNGVLSIVSLTGLFLSNYHILDLQVVYFIDNLIRKGKIRIVEESSDRHFLDKIQYSF